MPIETPITNVEDLRKALEIPESQVPTLQTHPDPLLPKARRELEKVTGPLTDQGFLEQEQKPGVPLQMYPGEGEAWTMNPWVRFQTARRQNVTDQQNYLETVFGKGNVRKAEKTDDFIIRVPDKETGKPRDVLLNEREITLGDVGALLGQAPEVGFSILLSALGGQIGNVAKIPELIRPITSGLGKLLGGAAGYKAGQALQQRETELEDTGVNRPVPIALEKLKELPAQTIADAFTAGIFKGFSTLNRLRKGGPGMFQTSVEKEGLPASQRLATKTATPPLSYSAGEASGMPLIDYLEAYAGSKPQSAAIRDEFKARQRAEVQAIYDAMTSRAGTDEQAGGNLLQVLEANQGAKQQLLDRVRKGMSERESAALTAQLQNIGPVRIPFAPSRAGQEFRQRFQGAWQTAKNNVRNAYSQAYSIPGAMDPDVPTTAIVDEIDNLLARFPDRQRIQWLQEYRNRIPATERYKDIVDRRSELWERIETSPADRETKDYVYGQLSKAMTDTLDNALQNIKSLPFAAAIRRANDIYKKEELPFYQAGLHDILRREGLPGSPENIELLKRFEKTDLYRRLGAVSGRGPGSAASVIDASIIDGLLTKSGRSPIDPKNIDASLFAKNLESFAANPNTREMFRDIFGNQADAVRTQARALMGVQGSLPKEELERFLQSQQTGRGTRLSLLAIKNAQDQLDRVEGRRLLKAPTEFVNPEQVANRFLGFYTESEIKALKARLETEAPGISKQLVDKVAEQILGRAGAAESITALSLKNVLNDPVMKSKYKLILGDRYDDLMDLSKALGPRDRAREIAKATGLLVKGESIGEIGSALEGKGTSKGMAWPARMAAGLMGIIPGWLGWKFTTKLITTGKFREWASKGYPPGWEKDIQAALITEPFLMDLAASSGSPQIVKNVTMDLRKWMKQTTQPPPERKDEARIQDVEELRKFLNQ